MTKTETYSIVLTDGKIINIKATNVEWDEKSRTIRLINNRHIVARINMDNVAGWIKSDHIAENGKIREGMSEISETEINSMTKEQNYMRGYKDGKSDLLNNIKAEIEHIIREETVVDCSGGEYERTVSSIDLDDVLEILEKHKKEI